MRSPKACALLATAILLSAMQLSGQYMDTHLVSGTAGFTWPQTQTSAVQADALPKEKVQSFLNLLRAQVPGYMPIRLGGFRFVPLEKGRYYLVAVTGGDRFYWNTDVVAPQGQGFQYSEMINNGALPLAMSAVDLNGDGFDELVTNEWPAGYQGASTPPIYWYTVWQFRNGVPRDASAQFPEFYRGFVLGQVWYVEILLSKLQSVDPENTRIPLAEIEYVRLKFQRVILGEKNAGLDRALAWAQSKKSSLSNMGIWCLAEMPAPEAEQELNKLAASPNYADVAKAALARRAHLFGNGHSQQSPK
jgi:hypothetical protein